MSGEFYLGLLLSVPIGIGCGLAVAPIQKWIDDRDAISRQTKFARQRDEYWQVLLFASRPELLSSYLILRLMAIVGFLAVVVLAYIGDQAFPKELTNQTVVTIHSAVGKVVYLTFIIGGFVGIFTTITRLVEGSLTLYHRVLNFDRYVESIPTDIRDAETEALVKRRGV